MFYPPDKYSSKQDIESYHRQQHLHQLLAQYSYAAARADEYRCEFEKIRHKKCPKNTKQDSFEAYRRAEREKEVRLNDYILFSRGRA